MEIDLKDFLSQRRKDAKERDGFYPNLAPLREKFLSRLSETWIAEEPRFWLDFTQIEREGKLRIDARRAENHRTGSMSDAEKRSRRRLSASNALTGKTV